MQHYAQAAERFAEINKLSSLTSILFWDSKVMMPAQANTTRGEQLAALVSVIHSKETDPALQDLVAAAAQEDNELDDWQRANVREMQRLLAHANALPGDLLEQFSRAKNEAGAAWLNAKADNDFKGFSPYLERVFSLQIAIAEAKSEKLGMSVYDVLLDQHDPGTSGEEVDRLFSELGEFLPGFIQDLMGRQTNQPTPLEEVTRSGLESLIKRVLPCMGWPTDGRIDHTEHPFAMAGVPGDPRITTHYDTRNPLFTLEGAFHECGHGLYELNLPKNEYAFQPVGQYRGGSTHESQSLGIEMLACRSEAFLRWFFPIMREELKVSGPAWADANLMAHYRHIQPGFIRIKADEVTYPLHIILRYRLEQDILQHRLAVKDIPDAWNDGMESLLGIRPPTDSLGCLQDIHWSMGLIGYFPTYLLGSLKAAQFFNTAGEAIPGLVEALRSGNFDPWVGWLRDNVHSRASLLGSDELVVQATGTALSTTPYIDHLQSRYL